MIKLGSISYYQINLLLCYHYNLCIIVNEKLIINSFSIILDDKFFEKIMLLIIQKIKKNNSSSKCFGKFFNNFNN